MCYDDGSVDPGIMGGYGLRAFMPPLQLLDCVGRNHAGCGSSFIYHSLRVDGKRVGKLVSHDGFVLVILEFSDGPSSAEIRKDGATC